jgi:hypothetical protein
LLEGGATNIRVPIDETQAGTRVWAMLHYDDDNDGVYGFPDEDAPVTVAGSVLVKPVSYPTGDIGLAVNAAMADLASRLGVSESQIAIESADEIEWSDASLGCPQPGQFYAQVITPGFKIILSHDGREYNYHSSLSGEPFLCEQQGQQETTTTGFNEYVVEADDLGLYPKELNVSKEENVRILFKVRSEKVYYGGLDFRSSVWGDTGTVLPGGNTTVEFTAQQNFTYTSYWPASGQKKADGKVNVAG